MGLTGRVVQPPCASRRPKRDAFACLRDLGAGLEGSGEAQGRVLGHTQCSRHELDDGVSPAIRVPVPWLGADPLSCVPPDAQAWEKQRPCRLLTPHAWGPRTGLLTGQMQSTSKHGTCRGNGAGYVGFPGSVLACRGGTDPSWSGCPALGSFPGGYRAAPASITSLCDVSSAWNR